MLLPDVNILVYAHRRDDPAHDFYRLWLEATVNGDEPFGLSVLSAVAFVRIVTHPGFRPMPTPLPQAIAVIEALRAAPQCRLLVPRERHWKLVRQLCEGSNATGKRVADAQHAAVAIEHGCTWVTRDVDFRAFESAGLRLTILEPPAFKG